MSATLADPEEDWRPASFDASDPLAEAQSRLGSSICTAEILSGGRANLNLRVDSGPVLRIYKRDPGSLGKEKRLLQQDWQSFRVPGVLGQGKDFILLEWLHLQAVPDDMQHGRAIGIGLAEIHSTTVEREGFLNAALCATEPLPNVHEFVAEKMRQLGRGWAALEADVSALLTSCVRQADQRQAVLNHGDFKPSNLFVDADGRLAILDWEFAFSGPRFFDCGQLFRWDPSEAFERGFEQGYGEGGGALPEDWRRQSEVLDLLSLLDLAVRAGDPTRRADLRRRIGLTLARAAGLGE